MRSFCYYWKEGILNIFKHGFMSIAAILIMLVSLLLTGTVTLLAYNINLSINKLQASNEIVVFVDESLSTQEVKNMMADIGKLNNIATTRFQSRDESLEEYREELGEDASLFDGFNEQNNPLRDSIILTLNDAELASQTIAELKAIDGVGYVRAYLDRISKLVQVKNVFNLISLAMIIGLALISVFIVSNTVKLAMFARREEISIQKMVGATNWFIRWPFVIEGMLIGLAAGLLAFFAEWGVYIELTNTASGVIPYFKIVPFDQLRNIVLAIYTSAGVLFGIGGSVSSIRKFMNV